MLIQEIVWLESWSRINKDVDPGTCWTWWNHVHQQYHKSEETRKRKIKRLQKEKGDLIVIRIRACVEPAKACVLQLQPTAQITVTGTP